MSASLVPGDTDGDLDVDAADYIALKRNMGETSGVDVTDGDFEPDGDVDWDGLQTLLDNYGETSGSEMIPEPATMIMLAAGLPLLLKRRRSQS